MAKKTDFPNSQSTLTIKIVFNTPLKSKTEKRCPNHAILVSAVVLQDKGKKSPHLSWDWMRRPPLHFVKVDTIFLQFLSFLYELKLSLFISHAMESLVKLRKLLRNLINWNFVYYLKQQQNNWRTKCWLYWKNLSQNDLQHIYMHIIIIYKGNLSWLTGLPNFLKAQNQNSQSLLEL